ncbi:MAG TPA: GvpL/GvpF family gas vesicle protein [Solirubrobacterales bacterium]|nr:GvpL/GvpF family gas vesicle protein [Solirubrobacterales bacterium]
MPATKTDTAKYVYGVLASGAAAPPGHGIDDAPLAVVPRDGVAALVSDVPADFLEAGREELLTHSRVLEEAMKRSVVLPMRFGVVLPDEAAVQERLLDPYAEELEAQLRAMEGKVEITIKGIYDEAAILREVLAENREIAKLREAIHGKPEDATYYQRIELGELVAAALDEKRAAAAPEIVDRLALLAADVRVGEPVHERMAVNASFLVERDRLAEFDRAVDRLGAEQAGRIQLKYTGPLPPHSFVALGVGG